MSRSTFAAAAFSFIVLIAQVAVQLPRYQLLVQPRVMHAALCTLLLQDRPHLLGLACCIDCAPEYCIALALYTGLSCQDIDRSE